MIRNATIIFSDSKKGADCGAISSYRSSDHPSPGRPTLESLYAGYRFHFRTGTGSIANPVPAPGAPRFEGHPGLESLLPSLTPGQRP